MGSTGFASAVARSDQPWGKDRAREWSGALPWLVGANYTPAYAVNELEMWQAATFDLEAIDRELGWAASLTFNIIRVFLHDLLWQQDPRGMLDRMDRFLAVAAKHRLHVMFVLFDSVWNGFAKLGPQPAPLPGVHNSQWLKSPSLPMLQDPGSRGHFEEYVTGVVSAFGRDSRVLVWDIWNEPDNTDGRVIDGVNLEQRLAMISSLLSSAFLWARNTQCMQPLTSGVWQNHGVGPSGLSDVEKIQFANSDVVSFHSYQPAQGFEDQVKQLLSLGRPLFCTEYMARSLGSTVETILPVARSYNVAALNWGLVTGKTQTRFPWDPSTATSDSPWFHDLLKPDGTPYRQDEAAFLRGIHRQS